MKTYLFRSEESRFRFPSGPNANVGQSVFDSKMFTQKHKTARDAAHRKNDVDPSVSTLFFSGGPIAIVLAVSQFVVSTFYAQSGWWFSHIRQKCREVFPFWRDFNATTAMVMVFGFVGILASLPHVLPCRISSCGVMSKAGSMNPCLATPKSTQTAFSTGIICSRQKVNAVFYSFGPAITFAQVVIWPCGFRENYKLAKSLANQGRFSSCHSISFFDAVSWRAGNAQYRLAAFQYAYSPSIYQG